MEHGLRPLSVYPELTRMFWLTAAMERSGGNRGIATQRAGAWVRRSWSDLMSDSTAIERSLVELGLVPGDNVAFGSAPTLENLTAMLACWRLGVNTMILPRRYKRMSSARWALLCQTLTRQARTRVVIAEGVPTALPIVGPHALTHPQQPLAPLPAPSGWQDVVLFQPTSGTTAAPRLVPVTQAMLDSQLAGLRTRLALDANDATVSWLPLHHDMGLLGLFLLPAFVGASVWLSSPERFLAAPRTWWRDCSDFGATFTGAPNFAYALASRLLASSEQLDLTAMRIAAISAEPIDPTTVECFLRDGARHGLIEQAIVPAYGAAEATLAISCAEPGREFTVTELGEERLATCGRPIDGMSVRLREATADGLGELEISGPMVMRGYVSGGEADGPEWLATGDLGLISPSGEVVVQGRADDVIIINGCRINPEVIERAVGEVEGVRSGNVIAFAPPSAGTATPSLVVVAERSDRADGTLARAAASATMAVSGVHPAVCLVERDSLPKTTSGKLQRRACRESWLAGEIG